jgi:hypothetical protein
MARAIPVSLPTVTRTVLAARSTWRSCAAFRCASFTMKPVHLFAASSGERPARKTEVQTSRA